MKGYLIRLFENNSKNIDLSGYTGTLTFGGGLTLSGAVSLSGSLALGSSGSPISLAAGAPKQTLYATSSSTNGSSSVESFLVYTTMTGAGGVGGRARFYMTANVALGGWSNALKAEVVYGASGRTTGLGSAFCAEMTLSAGTSSGTYAPLEIELNLGSGALTGTATAFMYLSAQGADVGTFDDNGFLFILAGVSSGSAHLWYDHQGTAPANVEEWLRVKTPAGTRYLPLYNAVV